MELSSLQVCMDTSNWLQEHNGTNSSSSSPSGDMITCSRPLETRLRPPTDQPIKCPRCDSARTKFCYYNNYSLSQPRYFCKTCRRYWTKGGSLRNIPVGGGCRKNKRVTASKKQNEKPSNHCHSSTSSPHHPTGLQLSFPDVQFSHLSDLLGNSAILGNTSFMDIGGGGGGYNAMLENSGRQQNQYFMESKFDEILGNTRSHDFMGINDSGLVDGLGDFDNHPGFTHSFHGFCSSAGVSSLSEMETSQRLMLPFEGIDHNASEIKPTKLLSLDLQDHGCNSDHNGKDSIGYLDNIGSWNAVMHGYGSSATIL